MLTKIINKFIGDFNTKELKKVEPLVQAINEKEVEYQSLSEEDLKKKTQEFQERLEKGETVDDILVEAFATVKNACRRLMGSKFQLGKETKEWDMIPYDCQLIGGIVLNQGRITEMKTGEGKTLVACLPTYLNALTQRGVHLITVNDYLAERDAEWMSHLYKYLGMSVGVVIHGITPEDRKAAYECDITYGTNNEFGFDYLRDNMVREIGHRVQRDLHYAIVDEVDSILIDEARTPLIISAPAEESTQKYYQYCQLIKQLQKEKDFIIDEKAKAVTLTEEGVAKMESLMGVENIYTEAGFMEVHHIEQALKAKAIFQKDTDYVIKEDEIVIVDEFTGRLMPGRRYSDGLHQAIEAKENVEVKRESRTLATVTFQNYFRIYDKLSGMTGTAKTEEEEFFKIYGLEVLVIPTHRPIKRKDLPDAIFKNTQGKWKAVAEAVKEYYQKEQPVLVGTISVEKSEMLSKLLKVQGVPHEVLNAKNHEREAEIVAKAGQAKSVTIATNMAGRGTDIKLGEGVKDNGGLTIIGTERHDSRRIDNQLRGRAGRQGDAGESRFFISMDDDLMRLFGSDRIQGMMDKLGLPDDLPIENRIISKSIESAQKRVEGHNFDIRKHLLEYDDVMNKHREIIYSRRLKSLTEDDLREDVLEMLHDEAHHIVTLHTSTPNHSEWDLETIVDFINALLPHRSDKITIQDLEGYTNADELTEFLKNSLVTEYNNKESDMPEPGILRRAEKEIMLHVIDTLWMEHIDQMTQLRETVSLRGYGQRDPLLEYKQEAFTRFKQMLDSINHNIVNTLFKAEINMQAPTPKKNINPAEMQTNEDAIENQGQAGFRKPRTAESSVADKIVTGGNTPTNAVGRNEPCPCGSGKKYKKCCGR